MNQEELQRVVTVAVNAALDSRDRIDAQTHRDDHAWVEEQRRREKKWDDVIEKVKLTVVGAITVAIIGGILKGLAFIGAVVLAALSAKTGGGANG
jgi:hypothetical protein